ncbi:hypothetical protein [Novosphingobium sp.]|uniref:hypothetical protein n=1 Tax=Novosphingobium sp. TaxID=1874826 RepID=UPI003018ACB9
MATNVRARWAPQIERDYFLAFLALGVAGVVLGFVPPSWARFNGLADYPAPITLQIHAGLFLGWVVLLAAQIVFIRQGNPEMHKRLGLIGAAMIPAMAISSVFAETYSDRFAAIHQPGGQRFLIVPIFSLGLFLAFTTAGLLLRRRSAIHKRLMFLGTTLLFGAAWSRVTEPLLMPIVGNHGMGFFIHRFIMTNAFLIMLAMFDWRTKGRLLPVSVLGISVTVGAEIAVTALFHTAWWLGVADAILVYFPGP